MHNQKFRFDIQTLRALAVIAVLLYHFKFDKISGGFIGVDVFFVISGYLISKSLLNSQAKDSFSFTLFYFNRIKRLYPALLVTILITYIAGYLFFSDSDFESLSASAVFSSLGLSNIYFWLTSGYFDSFSQEKPLLHTWSLSVEFQFYLIWPLILILIAKKKSWQLPVIVGITLISGIVAYLYLFKDSNGAFYLTPFRIHEFSMGTVIFLLESRLKFNRLVNTLIVFTGYCLIFIGLFTFDSNAVAFPGLYVWIPVLGSSLIIFAGSNTYIDKLLSFKPFVYTGAISYSLYLVHWPLFVFFVTNDSYEYTNGIRNQLLIYSLLLAVLLYYFVEQPFRIRFNKTNPARYTIVCLSFLIALITLSISSVIGNGWSWRYSEETYLIKPIDIKTMQLYTWTKQLAIQSNKQFINNGKDKILLIGDSQGADIVNLFNESNHLKDMDLVSLTVNTQCGAPYIEKSRRADFYKSNLDLVKSPDLISLCNGQWQRIDDLALLFGIADKVIISFNWNDFNADYLFDSLTYISDRAEQANIWVVGRKEFTRNGLDIYRLYHKSSNEPEESLEEFAINFVSLKGLQAHKVLQLFPKATFINMYDLIKSNNGYEVITDTNESILFDTAHFTPAGAKYLGDRFFNLLYGSSNEQ